MSQSMDTNLMQNLYTGQTASWGTSFGLNSSIWNPASWSTNNNLFASILSSLQNSQTQASNNADSTVGVGDSASAAFNTNSLALMALESLLLSSPFSTNTGTGNESGLESSFSGSQPMDLAAQILAGSLASSLTGTSGENNASQFGNLQLSEPSTATATSSSSDSNNSNTGKVSGNFSAPVKQAIQSAAEKYNVPANLLSAVVKQESGGNPNATSSAGAMGLMQLMPGTAKTLGVSNPYDIQSNVDGGAKYLSQLLNQFDGNIPMALAAYNAGPGAVEKYDGIPPYAQTQNYVKSIMANLNQTQPETTNV